MLIYIFHAKYVREKTSAPIATLTPLGWIFIGNPSDEGLRMITDTSSRCYLARRKDMKASTNFSKVLEIKGITPQGKRTLIAKGVEVLKMCKESNQIPK